MNIAISLLSIGVGVTATLVFGAPSNPPDKGITIALVVFLLIAIVGCIGGCVALALYFKMRKSKKSVIQTIRDRDTRRIP